MPVVFFKENELDWLNNADLRGFIKWIKALLKPATELSHKIEYLFHYFLR